jgi:hypothetical protein
MFEVIVTNYGNARMPFPTRIGNLSIGRLRELKVTDRGVYKDLKRFEKTAKLGFKVVVDDENGHSPASADPGIDFGAYSINELRSIASGKGVKEAFFKKKVDLIKILKED